MLFKNIQFHLLLILGMTSEKDSVDEVIELFKDNLIIIKSTDQIKELQTVIRNEFVYLLNSALF